MPKDEIKLKVAEAIQEDINKGIVRVDTAFLKQIDVRPGSIVEIIGERSTVGIADRALPGGIARRGLAGCGRKVSVRGPRSWPIDFPGWRCSHCTRAQYPAARQ